MTVDPKTPLHDVGEVLLDPDDLCGEEVEYDLGED